MGRRLFVRFLVFDWWRVRSSIVSSRTKKKDPPLIFSRFLFNQTATMKFHPQSTAYWLLIAITLTSTTSISSAFVAQPSGLTAAVTTCTSRCNHGGRIGAPLHMAQDEPSKDEKSDDRQSYIDAVVEEKTAGLAEVDEENTSVRVFLCMS